MCKTTKFRKPLLKYINTSGLYCYYCGKIIASGKDLTIDHVIPKSRGGKNDTSNYVVCCKKCNVEKGNMTEKEYRRYLRLKKFTKSKKELHGLRKIFSPQRKLKRENMTDEEIVYYLKKNLRILVGTYKTIDGVRCRLIL